MPFMRELGIFKNKSKVLDIFIFLFKSHIRQNFSLALNHQYSNAEKQTLSKT